jgi:hypothetical protein
MDETSTRKGRYGRRIVWLGVAVVVLIAAYTAGWFWLARKIEGEASLVLARLQERGMKAECANLTARGYPFRIGLFCDRVAVEQTTDLVSVSAGAFRSAGQIYDPMLIVAELDGPASFSAPGTGTLDLDWEKLRASARLAQPLPKRVSLEGSGLRVTAGGGTKLVGADTFEGHMRPNDADLDLAAQFAGLVLDPVLVDGRSVPPLSGEADISVADGASLLGDDAHDLRGRSGVVRNLSLTLGTTGSLQLSGPFSIAEDGLIDGNLRVSLQEPKALAASLSQIFPEEADKIDQALVGLTFLGNQPSLPLRISKGRVSLGFIPLGKIPPVR